MNLSEPRNATRTVLALFAVHALLFLCFRPGAPLVSDEAEYLSAATAYSRGVTHLTWRDGLTGEAKTRPAGLYPAGTGLVEAPFVRLLGPRGAPLASLLAYLATALLLVAWLRSARAPLIYSLLYIGYLPALALSRVGMSDVLSGAIVTAALYLWYRGFEEGGHGLAFLTGFLGGISSLFRETNLLFVAAPFSGTLLRREKRFFALSAGFLVAVALRFAVTRAIFGDALFVKDHGYGWSSAWFLEHLPLYLFALLVLAPFGLLGLAYRGPRRAEIVGTILLVLGFFLAYGYSGGESGRVKQLVLGPRYFIPLVPLLAFALAEVAPRWTPRLPAAAIARFERFVIPLWVAGIVGAMAVVQTSLWRLSRDADAIAGTLCRSTDARGPLFLAAVETEKYLSGCGARSPVDFGMAVPERLPALVARDGVAWLAILERSDSPFHLAKGAESRAWLERARHGCQFTVVGEAAAAAVHLRVYRAGPCGD
jgi:hypothetical protein